MDREAEAGLSGAKEAPGFRAAALQPRPPTAVDVKAWKAKGGVSDGRPPTPATLQSIADDAPGFSAISDVDFAVFAAGLAGEAFEPCGPA